MQMSMMSKVLCETSSHCAQHKAKGAEHALFTLAANSNAPSTNTKPVSSGTDKICRSSPVKKAATFSANTMCQLFLDIYKACGLRDASSHSGRRTYITKLANKGVGVRLLAELAGHSHISTTQRYIDVNAEQLKEAVELL